MSQMRRQGRVAIFVCAIILTALFVWFVLPRLFVLFLPFILAFLLSKIVEPVVRFLNKKIKIPIKIASAVMVLIVVGLLFWLIAAIIYRVVTEISALVAQADVIAQQATEFFAYLQRFVEERFGVEAAGYINTAQIGETVSGYLTGYIWPTIERVLGIAKSLPNVIVFIVALVLGTYFMSSDSAKVSVFMQKFVPKSMRKHAKSMKTNMVGALIGYIRAQAILMCITFAELSIGFTIIGGQIGSYALLLGLILCIIDALPILGTGTVLIPWGLYQLIFGDIRLGIYLLILYVVCLLVRQLLEPKILSGQIGLHPLITLMTMYAGLKIIGFIGMIIGPVLAIVIKNLSDSGFFRVIWNMVWYGTPVPSPEEE